VHLETTLYSSTFECIVGKSEQLRACICGISRTLDTSGRIQAVDKQDGAMLGFPLLLHVYIRFSELNDSRRHSLRE